MIFTIVSGTGGYKPNTIHVKIINKQELRLAYLWLESPVQHEGLVPVGVVRGEGQHALAIPGPRDEAQGAQPDEQGDGQHSHDGDEEHPRCGHEAGGCASLLPEVRLEGVEPLDTIHTRQLNSAPSLDTCPEAARPL